MTDPAVSIVIPTFGRDSVLVDTLRQLRTQLCPPDEVIVVDQTSQHEIETTAALEELVSEGAIRWYQKRTPSISEAMNVGALLARNEIVLFLDDDIAPGPALVEAHRQALMGESAPPATCGQVLQPWDAAPVDQVRGFHLDFNAAYSKPCDVVFLMAGNFAIRREAYLQAGGMDENFQGVCYRLESEFAERLCRQTGRQIRFVPAAGIRHLRAAGGTRAFGEKESWRHISGSIGDYYFALRSLSALACARHAARRLIQESVNRSTITRPWRIPSLVIREMTAAIAAIGRFVSPARHLLPLEQYQDVSVSGMAPPGVGH